MSVSFVVIPSVMHEAISRLGLDPNIAGMRVLSFVGLASPWNTLPLASLSRVVVPTEMLAIDHGLLLRRSCPVPYEALRPGLQTCHLALQHTEPVTRDGGVGSPRVLLVLLALWDVSRDAVI